jgi:hypothetical protein
MVGPASQQSLARRRDGVLARPQQVDFQQMGVAASTTGDIDGV